MALIICESFVDVIKSRYVAVSLHYIVCQDRNLASSSNIIQNYFMILKFLLHNLFQIDELYWISGSHGILSTSDGNKDCIRPITFFYKLL